MGVAVEVAFGSGCRVKYSSSYPLAAFAWLSDKRPGAGTQVCSIHRTHAQPVTSIRDIWDRANGINSSSLAICG